MLATMKTLAERITESINGSGVSIADVATACGVKVQSVYQWMNGETKSISGENLVELSAITGYEARWIANEKGQKTKNTGNLVITDPGLINAVHALEKMPPELRAEQIRGIYTIAQHVTKPEKSNGSEQ